VPVDVIFCLLDLKGVVRAFLKQNLLLTPEAFKHLWSLPDPLAILTRAAKDMPGGGTVTIDYLHTLDPNEDWTQVGNKSRRPTEGDPDEVTQDGSDEPRSPQGSANQADSASHASQARLSRAAEDVGERGEHEQVPESRPDLEVELKASESFEAGIPTGSPTSSDEHPQTDLDAELLFESFLQGLLNEFDEVPEPDPSPAPLSELEGKPVCTNCGGSGNVIKRDAYQTTRGEARDYFSCTRCCHRVPVNVTGRRHTAKTVAVVLSRFFAAESTRNIQTGMLEEDG